MEYNLRKPIATDIFVVSKILKGIGVKNIVECFTNGDVIELQKIIKDKTELKDDDYTKAGIMVVSSIVDLVLDKLEDIQQPLIKFMSLLSGLKVKDIEQLPPADFIEMAIAIIKMPEFVDFIKVVLKSLN